MFYLLYHVIHYVNNAEHVNVCLLLSQKSRQPMTAEQIAEIEMDYFPQDSLLGLFRLCRVYIDSCLVIGEEDTVSTFWRITMLYKLSIFKL